MSVRTIYNLGGAILAGGLVFVAMGGALAQTSASPPNEQTQSASTPNAQAPTSSTLPDAEIQSNVLRALASAPELSSQNIQTSTVYGTVTLTGNVQTEELRTRAENLAARALGVKKVVDELTLGDTPAEPAESQSAQDGTAQDGQQPDPAQANQPVLQSDGTYAPAPGTGGAPQPDSYPQNTAPIAGGQHAGIAVSIPAGAVLRVRINRGLDSNHVQPGTNFDGTVLTDVVAGGVVAIPRGATVTGTVVDAKKAGVFKGKGEIALQIDSLTLGGGIYPLTTEVWARNGRDKTSDTVNNTVGLGAIGAIFGAVAGGGAGAAIGAGVGAGAGLAGSAASPRGQILIPPESILTFRTAAPTTVNTVSEREMQRLSYAAGPQQPQGPPPPYYRPR